MSHLDVSWMLEDEFLKLLLSLFIFHIGKNFIWTDNIEAESLVLYLYTRQMTARIAVTWAARKKLLQHRYCASFLQMGRCPPSLLWHTYVFNNTYKHILNI